jgi:hypothetical protein
MPSVIVRPTHSPFTHDRPHAPDPLTFVTVGTTSAAMSGNTDPRIAEGKLKAAITSLEQSNARLTDANHRLAAALRQERGRADALESSLRQAFVSAMGGRASEVNKKENKPVAGDRLGRSTRFY